MDELLPFQKRDGIMVDLETLSIQPTASIISIGACKFSFKDSKIIDTFKVNVDPASCKPLGMHFCPDTMAWWKSQPRELTKGVFGDPVPISEAISMLTEWWNSDMMFWCNGLSFDAPILSNAYYQLDMKKPWVYWDEMDLRTAYSMVGFSNRKARANSKDHHDALADALAQTKQLQEFFGY